jgi:hypothetical protein
VSTPLPIKWAAEVAEHDYGAAEAYLSLQLGDDAVAKAVKRLKKATLTRRRATDILRASGSPAAGLDDPGVIKELVKIIKGEPLSPILVVRHQKRAEIADGFHRASLVYQLDPHADVPLKIA